MSDSLGYDWGYAAPDPTTLEGYGVNETGRGSTSQLTYDPTQIEGYGVNETGASTGLDKFGNILQSLFGGNGLFDSVTANRLAQLAAFGGLGGLLSRMGGGGGSQAPVGYQGGIPKYTVERRQTPLSQQRPEGYRPGQGGITYFTPTKFTEQKPVTPVVGADTQTDNPGRVDEQSVVSAAHGGYMPGGITMLAGGRYLRGPGDGVSDSIPAKFEQSGQPARLADGEFVIDARTVSEIGNGSSEAGARKLYAMMDRVHKARKKAVRGKPSGADKFLPK